MGPAVGGIASIAVDGQRQFEGNTSADGVGYVAGAARQQLRHQTTRIDIVAIVVGTFL